MFTAKITRRCRNHTRAAHRLATLLAPMSRLYREVVYTG
jgi:hypothetical protein